MLTETPACLTKAAAERSKPFKFTLIQLGSGKHLTISHPGLSTQ